METEGPPKGESEPGQVSPEAESLKAFRRFEEKSEQSLQSFERFVLECQACQSEAEPHWQFCAHCGTRLATKCPACDAPLPPSGAKSCPHCGVDLPEVVPPAPTGGGES